MSEFPQRKFDMAPMPDKQVRLVPLTEEWIDQLIQWRSRPEAQQHQPITALSRERLHQYLQSRNPGELADLVNHDYIFIIEDEGQGEGLGWMTLEIISRLHGLARIGYTIAREYWGQGYATAAVRAIVRWLFIDTPIERIEADCSVSNPASRRVLEKCGFRYIGLKRKYLVIQGQRVDHYYFELCKNDIPV
ncbi:MAG: GNAT family N-acetyltransferase [Fidelibacterota bacterium]|nr:MAG: GNAT family N-acetyltransferase [Candidatus Neomarinimicrobiota bacterium]